MYIIDRIEGNKAVIEVDGEKFIIVKRNILPLDAKEGDCLSIKNGVYSIDWQITEKRRLEIKKIQDELLR